MSNTFEQPKFPKIMGILNVTPDSFSDGGLYYSIQSATEYALKMLEMGADIIDIGGESTRPFSEPVSAETEIKRVIPVIENILKHYPDACLSIDTTKYDVAFAAVETGVKIINDVSGLKNDMRLAALAGYYNIPIIIMHMKGNPQNMQMDPTYTNLLTEIFDTLEKQINLARSLGANKIYADVGIGFGKTYEHNIELLKNHRYFLDLNVPLVLGLSRKSFIGKMLDIPNPLDRDIPTVLIHSLLLNSGASIIRVHNVNNFIILKKIYLSLFEDEKV
ncbi:MAG: dihydropteroate synthase [Candidatus Kapabacteria bacterium]|nr:dihydropteroate synthase [Candidatus Kapabacteria bacterium]